MNLLLIKLLEVVFNLILTYKLAAYLGEEYYFLIGILNLYTIFLFLISNIGIENIIIRNYLYWESIQNIKQINYYEKLAFFSKKILGLLCSIILLFLSLYYYFQYKTVPFYIFVIFIISANINSFLNTEELLLISRNKYNEIYYSKIILFTCFRLILIFLNLKYNILDKKNFLVIYSLIPVIRYYYLHYKFFRDNRETKIKLNDFLAEIKNFKIYIIENYSRFFSNIGDQLFLSFITSKEIFSTYSLIKNIETTGTSLIEVIFDPLIQKEVKNKNNIFELNKNYTKINTLKNILLIVGVIVLIVYYLNGVKLINILHFEKYKNFYEMSLGIEVCLLFYLSLKVKLNYINLFFSPNYRIYYSCFWIVITPLYFILSEKNIVVIRILYYVLYFFITNIIFKKLGGRLSEKNIHYDV